MTCTVFPGEVCRAPPGSPGKGEVVESSRTVPSRGHTSVSAGTVRPQVSQVRSQPSGKCPQASRPGADSHKRASGREVPARHLPSRGVEDVLADRRGVLGAGAGAGRAGGPGTMWCPSGRWTSRGRTRCPPRGRPRRCRRPPLPPPPPLPAFPPLPPHGLQVGAVDVDVLRVGRSARGTHAPGTAGASHAARATPATAGRLQRALLQLHVRVEEQQGDGGTSTLPPPPPWPGQPPAPPPPPPPPCACALPTVGWMRQ